jgi:pimeloyl-ACP methyl ester carboxylesterase
MATAAPATVPAETEITMRVRSLAAALVIVALRLHPASAQGTALDRAPSWFAMYQGHRVHYKSLGTGSTAVVFVHGWNGDISVWRGQVSAVDGRVRALFVDLPGFGRSEKPEVAYTMDHLAGGLAAVLRGAGVQRAVLVGHSMGTPVIRQFYRSHPQQVVGLVAVDGSLRGMGSDTAAMAPLLAQLAGPDHTAGVNRMFDAMLVGVDSALRAMVKRAALTTAKHVSMSSMHGMLDPRIWKDDPIQVPVLAIMAPNPMWSADYLTYVKRLAPQIRTETMEGTSHFLMLQRPAEFNALLTEFLRTLRVLR